MSNDKNTTEANQPDAAIDTARLLGVPAFRLQLYGSSRNRRAKLHLAEDSSEKYFCGSTMKLGNLINDEIDKDWVNRAIKAPENLCSKCLSIAVLKKNGLA